MFYVYLVEHPLGRVYTAPFDVLLSDFDMVEPDLLYVSHPRMLRQMTEERLVGAPDLVVEILSKWSRLIDEGVKLRLYERFGVSEYWVIDPEAETVRVYRLRNRRLEVHAELSREKGTPVAALSTPLLPGLNIQLARLFARGRTMEKASTSMKLTYQDLLGLPEDLLRHELIDGEHYVTPSPNTKHQRVVMNLGWLVRGYLEEHPIGEVFASPLDIVLSKFDVVEPDLLYISRERLERHLNDRNLAAAPELVIEVLSPSTRRRDEGVKHRLYERYGVLEYWRIDPVSDAVKVFHLVEGRFVLQAELSLQAGSPAPVLTTPLLPGIHLPLDKIFG
jgi:Uma2 family endonuclease